MISFILNDKLIRTGKPAGATLLDFIRYDENLKGTKIGCREGDCGACTVICGQLFNSKVKYKTIVSCLTPLGNVNGKHIITIEGLNQEQFSPVQQTLVDYNGTQCGFCTPGFAVSLTAFLLSDNDSSLKSAIAAIDGNICRCTGYKSIERAASELVKLKQKANHTNPVSWLVKHDFLPDYFNSIRDRLEIMSAPVLANSVAGLSNQIVVGGGTDLFVQKPDEIQEKDLAFSLNNKNEEIIWVDNNICKINANASATDLMESGVFQEHFPKLDKHFKLISSTPIRNMGTIVGNIVNASPIGDLSIFFLALDAELNISTKNKKDRKVKLKDFFLDYKKFDLEKGEIIKSIEFRLPHKSEHFNFEKVSKRQHLDIASVNSAICLTVEQGKIKSANLSAGGVSPVPLFLKKTSEFLKGKEINNSTVLKANKIVQQEISPISDIRGSAEYKRLLLRQLIFAHFIELFPEMITLIELIHHVKS